jgi:uncharacterized alpha-E superfamily protein
MTALLFQQTLSKQKAESLFWLGRYAERVYLTLHLLRKHFDLMIDEKPDAYIDFCMKLGIENRYTSAEDFIRRYIYDTKNPDSILYTLELANDNAILLREDITSETLSFIQLSICHIKSTDPEHRSLDNLQCITDNMLAFWGSLDERIFNARTRNVIKFGRYLEGTDLHIRFLYSRDRVYQMYSMLEEVAEKESYLCDEMVYLTLKSYRSKDVLLNQETLTLLNKLFKI